MSILSKETMPLFIKPDWDAPSNVVALTTCRQGGISDVPFDSFNLGLHVGDVDRAVYENRQKLTQYCKGLHSIQWLSQVHGNEVITIGSKDKESDLADIPEADACYTTESSLACAVMTADCLPIVFCDVSGSEVAVAHAGWRGLLSGVIESTLKKFHAPADEILVWLGPAISQKYFEVGPEVRDAFINSATTITYSKIDQAFKKNLLRKNHYFADLNQLARIRLASQGIKNMSGGNICCYEQSEHFFSFRRNNHTGRMATLVYRLPVE